MFLASPKGGTAHTKSRTDQNRGTNLRTNQNWKEVHVAVDSLYRLRPVRNQAAFVAVPVSSSPECPGVLFSD